MAAIAASIAIATVAAAAWEPSGSCGPWKEDWGSRGQDHSPSVLDVSPVNRSDRNTKKDNQA